MVDEVLRVLSKLDDLDRRIDRRVAEMALDGGHEPIRQQAGGRGHPEAGGDDDERAGRGGDSPAHARTPTVWRAAATRGWSGASGTSGDRPLANSRRRTGTTSSPSMSICSRTT